ncbi:MAG: RnfABCDGE type electron transport complex subunit D [Treponema sp.]|nr:RnfABCDGE type electron transport complex subunit D [Treponema sp.]
MSDVKISMPGPLLGSSPHIAAAFDTQKIMACVLISLAPALISGIVFFGLPALFTVLVSVIAAELAEFLFRIITRQIPKNSDLSAAVTGLLLALILPSGTPLWMTALGAVFAVVVAKEFFGGLGANVFNPALTGRTFMMLSFPAVLATFKIPQVGSLVVSASDAVTGATPLGMLQMGATLDSMGTSYAGIIKTFFLGNHAGSIGETSALAVLIGFIFLLIVRVIDWRTPVSMLAAIFIFSFFIGKDPLIAVMGGGAFFGAVFMATDYVTTPINSLGKILFGLGAGIIIVLIREWGAYPEGVAFSILIMNAVTPFLDRFLPKKYGYVKPAKAGGK